MAHAGVTKPFKLLSQALTHAVLFAVFCLYSQLAHVAAELRTEFSNLMQIEVQVGLVCKTVGAATGIVATPTQAGGVGAGGQHQCLLQNAIAEVKTVDGTTDILGF